jgi:hypothetical protein
VFFKVSTLILYFANLGDQWFFFIFFYWGRGVASNTAYYGYPKLWILRYPAQRYHAYLRRNSNPPPSGWESDVLTFRPSDAPLANGSVAELKPEGSGFESCQNPKCLQVSLNKTPWPNG